MLPLRRFLQRELLALIGLLAALSAVLVWIGMGRSLEQQIQARSRDSLARLSSDLKGDLSTVEQVGGTVTRLWKDGRLSFQDIPSAEAQIAPLLEEFPLVANLVFVSVEGWGLSMSRLDDGLSSYHLDARTEPGLKRYFRKGGAPISSAIWEPTPYKVYQRPWWKVASASESAQWVSAYAFVNIPTHGISYAMPLRDSAGALRGALCVDIFLKTLSQRVWAAQPTPHAQALVSDAEGRALILPQGALSEISTGKGTPFLRRLGPDFLPLFQSLFHTWEARPLKADPFRLSFGGESYTCIAETLLKSHGVDWRLSLAIPDQDSQGPARKLSLLLLLAGLAIMALAAWRVVALASRFSAPLEHLAQQALSLGDGTPPSPVETPILEIRTLGDALLRAGEAIQEETELQRQLMHSQRIQVVGTLSGGIAHDVNNQLAAIIGQLDLGRDELPEGHPAIRRMDLAGEAAHRCSTMVRSLLRFSHQTRHEFQTCNLNELVQSTGNLLGRLLGGRIRLELDLDPGIPSISGDPVGLEQVLMNLVVNARDAMPQGGHLTISTRGTFGGGVCLAVRDTGVGIPAEILPLIFEPFFSTKEDGKGNGLGLAMVAGIIQTHGGRVEIRSQPWQGTEIEIFLGGDGARSEPTLPAEHGAAPAPALAGRRILVVEDEAHLRDLLAELFTTRGAMVTAAEHGEEGWQRLNAGTFDLVISDQQMPHLTGLELLARLRERDTELPVILVSGYGLEGVVEDRVRDPKLRILSKPFSFNRLLAVVGELL